MQKKSQDFIFTTDDLDQSIQIKLKAVVSILNKSPIDLKSLRQHCKYGIPDQALKIREFCWKLLLRCLPEDKSKWGITLQKNKIAYQNLIKLFLPQQKYPEYPIIIQNNPDFDKSMQQDFKIWDQIQKDTARTHSQLSFFSSLATPIMIPFLTGARKQKFRLMAGSEHQKYLQFMKNKELQRITYKYHIMTRILFIYAKLNPQIKYIQGMNEVLAPIFYLVNAHRDQENFDQSSCFFMLNNSMGIVLEMHIKDLDRSQNGITGKLSDISKMLLCIDPPIWYRLQKLQIDPFFYSMRWMTLLYSQQFLLFDVMRIWDTIFSYQDRLKYMSFLAISLLKMNKQFILKGQFTEILQKLQNLKFQIDVLQFLKLADNLVQKYKNVDLRELGLKEQEKFQKQKQQKKKLKSQKKIKSK